MSCAGIPRPVLRGVSFEVRPGESYGLVGESGCGKSTTAYAAVRYLPRNAVITGGRILVAGDDVTKMNDESCAGSGCATHRWSTRIRARALNPTTKVGPQVVEAFTVLGQSAEQARESALASMRRVQIADPERVFQRYPHQLSGGMQQRVVIAIALASDPQAAGPRRTDDRPRRHGRGERARSRPHARRRHRRCGPADRPQPRRHPDDVRPGRRDVRRQDRGGRQRGPGLRASAAPVHGRAAPVAAAPRDPQVRAAADDDPGHAAADRHAAPDVRVRRSLPARDRPVPRGRTTGRGRRQRPVDALPSLGAHRRAQAAAAGRRPGCRAAGRPDARPRPTYPRRSARAGTTSRRSSGSNLQLHDGETLGLVGESGSGKSTLAKTILGIESPDAGGTMELDDHALAAQSTEPADRGQAIDPDGLPEPRFGAQPRLDRAAHPCPLGREADRSQAARP